MLRRSCEIVLVLSLMVTTSLSAQVAIAAGVAVGQQGYESNEDNPKVVTEGEVLLHKNALGLHVAVQYADLSTIDGPLIAVHPDLVHRRRLSDAFYVLLGVGPSFIRVGSTVSETTWNAEGEIGRTWKGAELFARVRQYDFSISSERSGEAGPSGPAISIGARFALRR